jgi:hypothetical protein
LANAKAPYSHVECKYVKAISPREHLGAEMDIAEFKRILISFADEPTDVDFSSGKVVAQLRDDIIDVTLSYDSTSDMRLVVTENGQAYGPRNWLINRVARLPQLAERLLISTAVSDEVSTKSPFVTPEGTLAPDISAANADGADVVIDDVVAAIISKASTPLPGATSVLYITSDAGEGKTTVINRAARTQAEKFKRREAASLIVPIPLGGKSFLTFDDAVIAALVNKLRFNYLYYEAFINLVKIGAIVPAFDGYEEMLVEGSKGEAISALGGLIQNLDSTGTVLVAARKAFFEYVSFRTQAKLLDAVGDRSASFSRLSIGRWDKEKFLEYGSLRGFKTAADIFNTISARLSPSHPLLTRAVLVRRLFDVLEDGDDQDRLVAILGQNPHDYFYTFVDAIVAREANEKWLSRASGDVYKPLLDIADHHGLLSLIAQEMWQSSQNALRLDVVDILVDLYVDGRGMNAVVVRQIKERIKQHSLLVADSARGQALVFDHEDFQRFYLGEALGSVLMRNAKSDIRAFLSVAVVPATTVEQAIQKLIRDGADIASILELIKEMSQSETGFTFCKENCGFVAVRLAECLPAGQRNVKLDSLYLPPASLSGRSLDGIEFTGCHFQPTSLAGATLHDVRFINCEFERLEITEVKLEGCLFDRCKVDALLLIADDECLYGPAEITAKLLELGAQMARTEELQVCVDVEDDPRFKVLERFMRVFLRSTHVDESYVRLRVGKGKTSLFFDEMLPELLSRGVLEEVPWKGQGIQRRFKLATSLTQINESLEDANGSFDSFLIRIAS